MTDTLAPAATARLPWWSAYPQVWQAELDAMAAAGAKIRVPADEPDDPEEFGSPLRSLLVDWPHPQRGPFEPVTLSLIVVFPEAYPWMPCRVYLPGPVPVLPRHRGGPAGALCLLASDADWRADDTAAGLLSRQLPRLLAAARAADDDPALTELEEGAEPVWTRMPSLEGALLIDSAWDPPADVISGICELEVTGRDVQSPLDIARDLYDSDRRPLPGHAVLPHMPRAESRTADVPWVRLAALPDPLSPGTVWDAATAALPDRMRPEPDGDGLCRLLVLLPSERAGRQPARDWLLLVRDTTPRPGDQVGDVPAGQLPIPFIVPTVAAAPGGGVPLTTSLRDGLRRSRIVARRGYPAGRADLTARLGPAAGEALHAATVAVVGCGAVGGPVAFELARLGVGRLVLADDDLVDPATASRQLPGWRHAGLPKVTALAVHILASNPHVEFPQLFSRVGDGGPEELDALLAADLVVDTAANPALTRYLSAHARLTGTPVITAAATAGGWGGSIATFPSAGGGCAECLQLHRTDRTVPWPPARPDGQLLPAGCSHPTFVGAYPDLGQVALQTARTAQQLLARAADGQRAVGSEFGDLQVLTLRTPDGRPCPPLWTSSLIPIHPDCPLHPGDHGTDRTGETDAGQP